MDAKFQEYLDQISSEKYGEDVRSAIQHALVYLLDRFNRQKRTVKALEAYADGKLSETWTDVINLGKECGAYDITRNNLIIDDDTKSGYADMVMFIASLVTFLHKFRCINTQFPTLDENSSLEDLMDAMELVLGHYYVTEEIRMITGLHNFGDGNLAIVPISDVTHLSLTVSYIDLFPSISVASADTTYSGVDTRVIICLSSALPPDTIKTSSEFLEYAIGSSSPDGASAINDLSEMQVDTVYRIDSNSGLVYPIDITKNSILLDGVIDLLQFSNAKYLVIGQVSQKLTTGADTYYDDKALVLDDDCITGSLYANVSMSKCIWLNDR